MNLEQIIKKLEDEIKIMFCKESSGHDIYHLVRTKNIALKLQEKEGGDRDVIGVSAFLHDVHRIIQKETGKFCHPKDSLSKVRDIIENADVKLSEEKIKGILHCIEFHEEYSFTEEGISVSDIETLILQDADNLDAIGAIGIARTFLYGGSHGVPMWNPEVGFDREIYDEAVEDPSTIHHFYSKLLRLKDNMNTEAGKQLAKHRHEVMENYLAEFFDEWEGLK
ncbi:MAG: hypothetical protein A2Y24_01425 [Clostridiales bacterium GWE2_32_10]|nr:MAG: hypothetical protein A2Y24_01425 [Clostridiales bacterium GWE2_32_10]HBY19990.1 metal-dependent phosphohydrolase [Clostridiales bacterium]